MASRKPKIFVDVNIFVDVSEKRQGYVLTTAQQNYVLLSHRE